MFGWTGAPVEGGGGADGLVCNGGEYHTYEMEPHPQGSISQYTTVYHSIPQYIIVTYIYSTTTLTLLHCCNFNIH